MKCNIMKPLTKYKNAQLIDYNNRLMVTKRFYMAIALAMNDIWHHHNKRINRTLTGISEILNGYGVFAEHMERDMSAELKLRGIEIPEVTEYEDNGEENHNGKNPFHG